METFNKLLFAFTATDSRTTVYLKQSDETWAYQLKVMNRDGTKTVIKTTPSLSDAMREMAETIAQFTNGFTSWR